MWLLITLAWPSAFAICVYRSTIRTISNFNSLFTFSFVVTVSRTYGPDRTSPEDSEEEDPARRSPFVPEGSGSPSPPSEASSSSHRAPPRYVASIHLSTPKAGKQKPPAYSDLPMRAAGLLLLLILCYVLVASASVVYPSSKAAFTPTYVLGGNFKHIFWNYLLAPFFDVYAPRKRYESGSRRNRVTGGSHTLWHYFLLLFLLQTLHDAPKVRSAFTRAISWNLRPSVPWFLLAIFVSCNLSMIIHRSTKMIGLACNDFHLTNDCFTILKLSENWILEFTILHICSVNAADC